MYAKKLTGSKVRHTEPQQKNNENTTVLRLFFRDHSLEPAPEENFWSLWYKGRLTEADTPTAPIHPD